MTPSPSIPRESVDRFFQDVESRAWTDAEKELDNIRQNSENTSWTKGYVKALEGLMLSFRSNDDKYIFLPKVLANRSEESIHSLKKEFGEFGSNELHGEYDRGYFKALEEYLTTLSTTKPAPNVLESNVHDETATGNVTGSQKEPGSVDSSGDDRSE